MAKVTVTQLENCPYIPAGWWWDGPPGYYEFGGPGTFMEYYGKPMKLGSGDDLVVGMLGQLKDASIDGGKGYDIFQVNFTPEQVFGATMVTDQDWWDEFDSEGYYTIDSTYLLNSSLKNFEEIDFNGTPWFIFNSQGAPSLGIEIDNFYGLDIDEDFTVDASLLTIKKLGALANNDDATFVNLAASNQIIAKMGVLPTILGETLPFTLEEPLDSIELNLQAAREIRRDINPYGNNEHLAFGNFVDKGIVKLEVQKDVYATVTPNIALGYESDYQQLILSGAGHVAVANVEDDRFIDFRETSSNRVRPIEGNDNIVIDGRALTGGLYVQNDPFVTENMAFSTRAGIDSTNLVGSTLNHMDVITTSGKGDYIDISGDYWAPSWDDYGDINAYLPDAGTAVRIRPTGNLASQLAQADAYSAANNTVVWFIGVDRNTYVWDDGTPSAPAAPGGPAEQPGIYDDFVIKIVGSHILGFDAANGHLIL